MLQIVECGIVLGIYFILFHVFGRIIEKILHLKWDGCTNCLMGFFCYFSVFQIIAIPMIFFKRPLSLLSIIWIVVCIIAVGVCFGLLKPKKAGKFGEFGLSWNIILIFAVGIILCYYVSTQYMMGWDTAYYLGTINESLYTDTMYQYDGETGILLADIPMRYALSSFYMNAAVYCKIFGLPPLMVQKYVIAVICVILYIILLYKIAEVMFQGSKIKQTAFVCFGIIINFFFYSEFSTAQFLLLRSYEAKGYCANVIVLAVFWICLLIFEDSRKKKNWQMLFIIAFASVPVSMSAMLIVPAMIAVIMITDCIVQKSIRNVRRAVVCVLPNCCYLILYYLYTIGIFKIKV